MSYEDLNHYDMPETLNEIDLNKYLIDINKGNEVPYTDRVFSEQNAKNWANWWTNTFWGTKIFKEGGIIKAQQGISLNIKNDDDRNNYINEIARKNNVSLDQAQAIYTD